jgi:transglutaminase-like putative cysteine protease
MASFLNQIVLRPGKWFFISWPKLAPVAVVIFIALAGCGATQAQDAFPPVPSVVTADIQAGIEKHIEEQSRLGGGYFILPFSNKDLRLKLVRVHVEYLANLGLRYHFACVDLADTDGKVYDVDFFLKGDPGNMTVTETAVHKINGQPLYTWEQKADRTWHSVPVDHASQHLLGVITDRDVFEFLYRATLPEITKNARMWVPLAVSDAFQTIDIKSIRAPGKQTTLNELNYGNKVLFLELGPEDSNKMVEIRYQVQRLEKSAYAEDIPDPEKYLKPDRLVPINEEFRKIAGEVLAGKKGDLVRARALYDHVIDTMSYKKYGTGWGKGDAVYACDMRTGNCTDFHSYFIALSRAAGIPARFAIGAGIPSARDEGGISGYHCWAEFYAEGKWWPVDISEGDKYSSLATYYFGHHPANRIELSRGRDLVVEPGPASSPINFLAYPVFEMGGESISS